MSNVEDKTRCKRGHLHLTPERATACDEKNSKPSLRKASPWDVQTSAPPPSPKDVKRSNKAYVNWMDHPAYPVAKPEHAEQLDLDAAINEFHGHMPRNRAEKSAYDEYVRRERVAASAHHLAGMRAAHASGDHEAGRKHALMYQLHSKALGHDAVGPVHPEVQAALAAKPTGVHKFKPHEGDVFAVKGREPGAEAG